jgi:predicted regulator of Ras-like GTPase activity (Roadblock/LC7/MglB family)
MLDILNELKHVPGVRGAAIVLDDGVIVASALSSASDTDSYAALVSSLLSQITKCLPKLGLGNLRRATVTATRGRFTLTDLGGAWLVTEIERGMESQNIELDIESAGSRLRKRMRMRCDVPAAVPGSSRAPKGNTPTPAMNGTGPAGSLNN